MERNDPGEICLFQESRQDTVGDSEWLASHLGLDQAIYLVSWAVVGATQNFKE